MPKSPSLTSQKVIDILVNKGFVFERAKGSHHIYRNPDTKRMAVVPFHKSQCHSAGSMFYLRLTKKHRF